MLIKNNLNNFNAIRNNSNTQNIQIDTLNDKYIHLNVRVFCFCLSIIADIRKDKCVLEVIDNPLRILLKTNNYIFH